MANALIIADVHIKLGQKNVPIEWQKNRFSMLADELNKVPNVDVIVIAGDLLDVAKPSIAEIGLMYSFLKAISSKPIILIAGNHEMVNKTDDCYIEINSMLTDLNVTVVRDFYTLYGIDFIPYNIIKQKEWPAPESILAVTHVRGEIPPHVTPEIDLERFSKYEKVFAGDLHSVTNSQKNIFYPGSPITTSFHRDVLTGSNGYFIVDSITGNHSWHELRLPQLIKRTVSTKEEIVATDYHHTVYELTGSLEELKQVENLQLLDKKITNSISAPPTLNLQGSMVDELATYLVEVKGVQDPQVYIDAFTEIVPHGSN
jgi:DNA repair exonuclease SbcCD nuclease subunit